MIRVMAPSRLHFGLLQPTMGGETAASVRRFGGVGLMLASPGVTVTVTEAAEWSASGANAARAVGFARKMADYLAMGSSRAFHLAIESEVPEHVGLGSGTQLALAVGRAVAGAFGKPDLPTSIIGRVCERGRRSAIGIHGFDRGGLIVEVGKRQLDSISPLLGSYPLLDPWRIVLFLPRDSTPWHGQHERQAMDRVSQTPQSEQTTDRLCRMVLLELIPAALEGDLPAFGESVYAYNRKVGEAFAVVQGGLYSHPSIEQLVHWVRGQGVAGVGQSSWGPTVFAIVGSAEEAEWLCDRYQQAGAPGDRRLWVSAVYRPGSADWP
ncbi:beta-ribofuranosylaminobenzene 5'-phosphate synthase family protein [Tuwongella immobilis]|uniref:GHMP kinase C-terminal domain-containing protein n=1 Tax=Tuwongella immobilis TaxID=692036 RepID=A0A6C2YP43_9BACT|nr:beta-ribofuranosylaminobenzene 5'-phosphate synthase family protein [Tuwongella immobilis]VIP03137.1 ghmp kinase : Beta-ribofuranosylaminobenzene 5'-phosphate synthase OS=Gemmata sp. Wa1-1 GN=mptG PE=4 SV=1: GHMP_kinases_N: GHMP_kinases_C [Tuwongella immobilis]VTS03499.1 ghmp kinase : Beta-ribofuranosylaminobenzene 5'-phosphate synthase OS=Gemmata sp. Wa1-1 GN=mptG PE=4 SV=1: GHMP_kinases_N: GHMP_kinases_C [Tuwongella immobilis]